jgi:hypothetical protein
LLLRACRSAHLKSVSCSAAVQQRNHSSTCRQRRAGLSSTGLPGARPKGSRHSQAVTARHGTARHTRMRLCAAEATHRGLGPVREQVVAPHLHRDACVHRVAAKHTCCRRRPCMRIMRIRHT